MECKCCRQKKPRKTSNVVLIALGLFILAFVSAMVVTFWYKGSVPDILIQYVLGTGGIEALLLAGITITKVLRGEKTETIEEEQP